MLMLAMLMFAMLILGQRDQSRQKVSGFKMAELTITTVVSSIKEIADAIERLRNPSDIDLLKLSKAGLYKQDACYVRHTRGNCKHYVVRAVKAQNSFWWPCMQKWAAYFAYE
jgi:predicted transcriptional regulator YdeE